MEGGYKIPSLYIILGSILLSIFLGGIIYHTKTADALEESLRNFVEPYNRLEEVREKIWDMPEKGILPGQIIKIHKNFSMEMRDLNNSFWLVQVGSAHHLIPLREGQIVIVLGEKTGDHLFKAHEIRIKRGFFLRIKTMYKNL